MSPCANGTSKSFFSAKSFPAAPTRVTAYRWPVLPVCRKKSSIARKKFLPIWKVLAALRQNQSGEEENRSSRCRNRKSRNWICCEVENFLDFARSDRELARAEECFFFSSFEETRQARLGGSVVPRGARKTRARRLIRARVRRRIRRP